MDIVVVGLFDGVMDAVTLLDRVVDGDINIGEAVGDRESRESTYGTTTPLTGGESVVS
jgi:hypothetical protein